MVVNDLVQGGAEGKDEGWMALRRCRGAARVWSWAGRDGGEADELGLNEGGQGPGAQGHLLERAGRRGLRWVEVRRGGGVVQGR